MEYPVRKHYSITPYTPARCVFSEKKPRREIDFPPLRGFYTSGSGAYFFRSSMTRLALPSLRVMVPGATSRTLMPMPIMPRIWFSIFPSTA